MFFNVCAVKDLSAQCFANPMFVAHPNVALRSFTDEINRKPNPGEQSVLFSHPTDFELYHLGTYDDANARFDLFPEPKLLRRGLEASESTKS